MKNRKVLVMVVASLVVLAIAGVAMAFVSPAAAGTTVGYDLFDLIVNKIIKGPIGTAAGVVMLAAGAVGAAMGKLSSAAWPLVGGGLLVAAPTIATSLGMLF